MRQEKTITIQDGDENKEFRITQMGAIQADKFTIKLGLLLAKSGLSKTLDISGIVNGTTSDQEAFMKLIQDGISGLGGLSVDDIYPLLDELMETVERKVGKGFIRLSPDMIESQIEDPKTLWILRKEAFTLNMGFFKLGGASKSPAIAEKHQNATSQNPRILVKR